MAVMLSGVQEATGASVDPGRHGLITSIKKLKDYQAGLG